MEKLIGHEINQQHKQQQQHPERKSKVREYIAEKKRMDEMNTKIGKYGNNNTINNSGRMKLSLEDLYQVNEPNDELTHQTAKLELRKTLRLVKEKDMMILKLRETCHELTIKFAHAENTIDQLRFNKNKNGGSSCMKKSVSNYNISQNYDDDDEQKGNITKGDTDERKKIEMKDKSTETKVDILDESCSNWMEKVQNWKTDSILNAATSAADADSGFRGSELESNGRKKMITIPVTSALKNSSIKEKGNLLHQNTIESSISSRNTLQFQTTIGTNTDSYKQEQQHPHIINQPLLQQQKNTLYSQSFNDLHSFSPSQISHKSESHDKSLDRIFNTSSSNVRIDHFKTLDPLLDEATLLALRVQRKSRKLAKLIQCVDRNK